MSLLPDDPAERKKFPIWDGCLRYFPSALLGVARCSYEGNRQHNNGEELHHDRSKSSDELNAMLRHLMESELTNLQPLPGVELEDQVSWRVLSWSQKRKEANGAPVAPAARNAKPAMPVDEVVPHEVAAAHLRDLGERDDGVPGEVGN